MQSTILFSSYCRVPDVMKSHPARYFIGGLCLFFVKYDFFYGYLILNNKECNFLVSPDDDILEGVDPGRRDPPVS